MEQKRLKEQERFFEKKMMILQNGFRQLEEDRHALESQRREMKEISDSISVETVDVDILFRSIKNNPLALRKRYKDLLKIFTRIIYTEMESLYRESIRNIYAETAASKKSSTKTALFQYLFHLLMHVQPCQTSDSLYIHAFS